MKIGFIASSGGHWEEILCLSELAEEYDCFYVTEVGIQARSDPKKKVYTQPQINRQEKFFLLHFLRMSVAAFQILRKEKPDLVITTGALLAFPFCVAAKVLGSKLIYIESFARVTDCSVTGRLVYPFADLFLVQWKSMLKFYPKAKYIGGIF